ncbi:hypothetical protein N7465_008368 [Penicillium sp. CMV-2018d]|nr:hypothetical protein N7465_008368 [Penicillium sp. CMV-2018d]
MFRVDPLNANHSTRPPGQLIYHDLEYMPIKVGPSPGLNRGPRVLKMFRVNPLNANHSTRPPGQLMKRWNAFLFHAQVTKFAYFSG